MSQVAATGAVKNDRTGNKTRGESRSRSRKFQNELSQSRKENVANKKGPAVLQRSREEIEAETLELNQNAKDVLEAFKSITKSWDQNQVPL